MQKTQRGGGQDRLQQLGGSSRCSLIQASMPSAVACMSTRVRRESLRRACNSLRRLPRATGDNHGIRRWKKREEEVQKKKRQGP